MIYRPRPRSLKEQADNEYANYLARTNNKELATQNLLIQYVAAMSDIELPDESADDKGDKTNNE